MSNNFLPKKTIYDRDLSSEQIEVLSTQYQRIQQLKEEDILNNQLYLTKNREVYFPKGTLIHFTSAGVDTLRSISKSGILAPELIGKKKDGGAYYSAEFYKMDVDTLFSDFYKMVSSSFLFNINSSVAFVINISSRIGGLLYYDMLDSKFDGNNLISTIIDKRKMDTNYSTSAILGGLPAGAISGIIVSNKVILNTELIETIGKYFPHAYIITMEGAIIKDRSNVVKIEDFDDISLKYSQERAFNESSRAYIANLKRENKSLKKNINILLESIKSTLSPIEQAMFLKKIGYKSLPKNLLDKLSDEEKGKLNF